jgi:glutathione S-transferase
MGGKRRSLPDRRRRRFEPEEKEVVVKLYYSPGACSLAPHIVAREAGVPVQLVKVNLATHRVEDGRDFAAVNPKNYVPAIELDDGELLTEASALVQWLAEQAPDSGLLPAGAMARYRVQEQLNFIATELHKGFTPLWHKAEVHPSTLEQAKAKLHTRFAILERRLEQAPYLAGETFTVADAYAFTILNWAGMLNVDLQPYPKLRDYIARVGSRPQVQAALQAEGLLKKAA